MGPSEPKRWRGRSAAVALLVGIACLAEATAQAPEPTAEEVVARAREIYAREGPRAALPEFERALALFRQGDDRRGEAIVLGLIGNCYKRFGDFPKALDHLQRSLAMKQQLGDRLEEGKTHSHLGLVYWEMGDYARAAEALGRSIALAREVSDRQLEGAALNNLGLVYDEQGDYRRSLAQYERALELHRQTGFERGESDTLGNIGGVHLLLGRYREALVYYEQALAISERLKLKASASQDLGNIALCRLGLGETTEALAAFDRALALAREAGLAKEEADWHKGRGTALARVGRYDPALEEYEQARQIYEKAGLKRELVELLQDLGGVHAVLGDLGSAETAFRRAMQLSEDIGHPRGVTVGLLALGDLEGRRTRHEEAAALYRQAFTRAQEAEDRGHMAEALVELALAYRALGRPGQAVEEAPRGLAQARASGARPLEARALHALGEGERALGRFAEALEHYAAGEDIAAAVGDPELGWRLAFGRGQALESLGRDEEAVAAYRRAVERIESVRAQLREERFRAGYIEDKYQPYVALVRLFLKLGRIGDAFAASERLRARAYLEMLNRGAPPILDDEWRRQETELRERIRRLQRSVAEETEKDPPRQRGEALELFNAELDAAERSYQELLDDLRRTVPTYGAVRTLVVPSVEDVQRRLPADTALVEYVLGKDSLFVLVLTSSSLKGKTVPVATADLDTRVGVLRKLLLRDGSAEWRRPAEGLRRLLIEPIEREGWLRGIDRLYLVPHGILHYLPFATLLHRTEGARPRYLVEDYVLAYLPAAGTLLGPPREPSARAKMLALAPSSARLRHAQQEASTVSSLFGRESRALLGRGATESSFKRLAPGYDVLHLATHGTFNKRNPLFSGVELEADDADDGRLEVHELVGLRLNAGLVTLSACETALGSGYFVDVPVGDDFVGLTRAFLFAGSPSVLATLWEVDDRSTVHLMRGFYGRLHRADKATALAAVQRAALKGGRPHDHPYFWAPFVLVGRME